MSHRLSAEDLERIRSVELDGKFSLECGSAFMTGTEVLVRLPLHQRLRDAAVGLDTAGFVSGYRGSPLGSLDKSAATARKHYDRLGVVMQPGVNEDLAATSIWGTQQVSSLPGAKHQGVFGMWYGKGPGVDRSGDALRHANLAGTSEHGGVLMLAGDDHGAKSSSTAHQSDHLLRALGIPVLFPSSLQEMLDFGMHGWAMSRYTGLWVAMKCVTDAVDSASVVEVSPSRQSVTLPRGFALPPGGLSIRATDSPLEQEARMVNWKWPAAVAYVAANPLNQVIWKPKSGRIGIITAGKSYLDTRQAFSDIGIDRQVAEEIGLSLLKIGVTWPLEPDVIREFSRDLEEILVIEEKQAFLEPQIKDVLYGRANAPRVVGKADPSGREWLPSAGELSPAAITRLLWVRLRALLPGHPILARMEAKVGYLQAKEAMFVSRKIPDPERDRVQMFCSGCPHNSSTKVPEDSRAMAGIGCHTMAMRIPDRRASAPTHMGAEGATWIGQAPFTRERHVFVNLGDGTFFHSGLLAIRAAVAAKVNVTYKILFNDAVAMTGGQRFEGPLDPGIISRQVAAEGVGPIVVVTDEPGKYGPSYPWAEGVTVRHRNDLDAVQRELRECRGVTALIYDQTCAAEKRRRRKKGTYPDVSKRTVINAAVCEGCGDCGVQSNCLSIEPLETDLGRKRTINQSSCNKDFSCVDGFCPSFVTIEGAPLRGVDKTSATTAGLSGLTSLRAGLPQPTFGPLEAPYEILLTGVGGTGVVTVAHVLAMAAHLQGNACSVLDMSGVAQKGGAVMSHLRLGGKEGELYSARLGIGTANLVLGFDLLVTAAHDALARMGEGRTRAVVNLEKTPTSAFMRNPDWQFPDAKARDDIDVATGAGTVYVEATRLVVAAMGNAIATNMFLVGYAWQKGWIPLAEAAVERAIELNGADIAFNKDAFGWGRVTAHDPEGVQGALSKTSSYQVIQFKPRESLDKLIERGVQYLTAYQNADYAARYRSFVQHVLTAEKAAVSGAPPRLSEAVAKYLFKLMSYKDEYEVARLHSDPAFKAQLDEMFKGPYQIVYHLAPPAFARRDASGRLRKRAYGPWVGYAMRALARFKFLRGTPLDPFGYSAERQGERNLIAEYRDTIDELLGKVSPETSAVCVEIASLPEEIRGFGHVKERNILAAREKRQKLLSRIQFLGTVRRA
jgi:indolepyruvate ferredoxin oxidoreductase